MTTYTNLNYRKKQMKKILIIREGAIGDVVHTTNMFRAIKDKYPDTKIDYVTGKAASALIEHDSRLNRVFVLEGKDYKYLIKLASTLKKEKYDLVINLQTSVRFKFFAALIHAKKLVTYKKDFSFHAVENFFYTAKQVFKDIENHNDLILEIPPEVTEKVKQDLPADKKIVILNTEVSKTRQGRKWPEKYFKELALKLIEEYDCIILIPGSKEDFEVVKDYENWHENVRVIAGKYSILESAAVSSLSNVFVSGDTGPLHIASAVQKPYCIGLYGAAPIGRTGPWGTNHFALSADLDCIPCNKRKCSQKHDDSQTETDPCMYLIEPIHVFSVIKDNDLLV